MPEGDLQSPAQSPIAGTSSVLRRLDRIALKPLYYLYYGLLYGRGLPGTNWLAGVVKPWEARHGRRDIPQSRAVWEEEYGRGDWSFLGDPGEAARYDWLVEHVQGFAPEGSVLDVGCGEAFLGKRLAESSVSRYDGVDLSSTAIDRARATALPRSHYEVCSAEDFSPGRRYDIIVFNEIVYYFDDPIAELQRYLGFLADGGVLLLSVFESLRTRALMRRLRAEIGTVEEAALTGAKGTWRMAVIRPGT